MPDRLVVDANAATSASSEATEDAAAPGEVPKSAKKKLLKARELHVKAHEQYVARGGDQYLQTLRQSVVDLKAQLAAGAK